jgi:RimJ/RimL family protein N-acetyltransferase
VRLTGERLRAEHAAELEPLVLDGRVWPTLWPHPWPPTRDDVIAQLAEMTSHWQRHGFGLWLLRDRVSGAAVGRGGLEITRATGHDEVEVAWMIAPDRWGQGLATELARCALEVGLVELGLIEVVALTLPHNRASRRVMEKTGFVYERELEHAGLPHVLYRRVAPRPPLRGPETPSVTAV